MAAILTVAVCVGVAFAATSDENGATGASGQSIVGSVADPISPAMAVGWGERSHWVQPWRSYLDTWPASRFRDGVGINFNVSPAQADGTARLLAANGFRRARVEIGWGDVNYDNEGQLNSIGRWRTILGALKANGIRPLILLNSNDNLPCPAKQFRIGVVATAHKGDQQVTIAPGDVGKVVPGKTGFDFGSDAAAVLVKTVTPAGIATLAKPLPADLPSGQQPASTLKYEPFYPPKQSDGSPNPPFEATMAGWLRYVDTATHAAKGILGTDDFDVEIWNEASFGANFLSAGNYYSQAPSGQGSVTDEMLQRTVAWIRDASHGVSNAQVGDGFASQAPWHAGSTSPPGLNAIDKHPYKGRLIFPRDAQYDPGTVPLDASGNAAYTNQGSFPPKRVDVFTPAYTALFPEYFLTSIQTESMVRDLAPYNSKIGPVDHGRNTAPPGGRPPGVWVTEYNMDFSGGDPSNPATVGGSAAVNGAELRHLEAKGALRAYAAYIGKGVENVDLYAATGGSLQLVDPSFFGGLGSNGQSYPGDRAGGEIITSIGRMAAAFRGGSAGAIAPLTLRRIDDFTGGTQFDGNGTAAFPPLYNRDVLAFFPFQVAPGRYTIPVYVMTRDMMRVYDSQKPAGDASRFDMPEQTFRLTIGGNGVGAANATAVDPLTGKGVKVSVVARNPGELVVDMPVTDSPRLLELSARAATAALPVVRASYRVVKKRGKPRIVLHWRVTSGAGNVASYRVERLTGKGRKRRWKPLLKRTAKRSVTVPAKRSHSYRFRIFAVDRSSRRSKAAVVKVKVTRAGTRGR